MVRLVRYANCTYFLLLMLIDTRRERISLHLLWKFGPSINTTAQYNKIKHSCTRTHFLSKREFACLYYPICVREYVLLVINSFAAYDRMMYLTLMRQIHQVQNDCITNSRQCSYQVYITYYLMSDLFLTIQSIQDLSLLSYREKKNMSFHLLGTISLLLKAGTTSACLINQLKPKSMSYKDV